MMRRLAIALSLSGLMFLGNAPVMMRVAEATPPPTPGSAALITLELKGLDILDVLKLLSQKSDLSFVAGRNVTGRVTLFIQDVPIWDAFELIIAVNDLAYERRGNMVTVLTGRDYELIYGAKFRDPKSVEAVMLQYAKAPQVATVLNQIKSNVGRVIVDETSNSVVLMDLPSKVEQMRELVAVLDVEAVTRVWEIKYASVEEIQDNVEDYLTPNIGTMDFDERSNKLVVTDVPVVLEKIDALVEAFDVKQREVLIEAKIVEVTLSDTFKMGINWDSVMGGVDSEQRANFDVLGDVLGSAATGYALLFRAGGMQLNALIEALQTMGETEIISTPSITVVDREEAKILVGTKEAFVTTTVVTPGGGSPTTSAENVTFVDVGVSLTVTPTIAPDGFVSMEVRPEVSSVGSTLTTAQGNTIPIVKTSEAETTVLLRSGTTIMIGGLIEDRVENTTNKVPIIGDLPIIKHAFRSVNNTSRKTETLIFITPTIVTGAENYPQIQDIQLPESLPDATQQVTQTNIGVEPENVPGAYREIVWLHLQQHLAAAYPDTQPPAGTVQVAFALRPDGSLIGEPQITGVEDPIMLDYTRRAVIAASPFPRLPADSALEEVQFSVAISYGSGSSQ